MPKIQRKKRRTTKRQAAGGFTLPDTQKVVVGIPIEHHTKLMAKARKRHVSMNHLIRQAISASLEEA